MGFSLWPWGASVPGGGPKPWGRTRAQWGPKQPLREPRVPRLGDWECLQGGFSVGWGDAVLGQQGPVWGRARAPLGMWWGTKGAPKSSPSGQGHSQQHPVCGLEIWGIQGGRRQPPGRGAVMRIGRSHASSRAMTWDIAERRMWTQALPVPRAAGGRCHRQPCPLFA